MSHVIYDPEDVQLSDSPRLVPVQPNYRSEETPPPLVPEDSLSTSSSPESGRGVEDKGDEAGASEGGRRSLRKGKRRKGRRTQALLGDVVLIRSLEPNRPDIANQAEQEALYSASQSEAEDSGEGSMGDNDDGGHDARHVANSAVEYAQRALEAGHQNEDFVMVDMPPRPTSRDESMPDAPMTNGTPKPDQWKSPKDSVSDSKAAPSKTFYNTRPPPREQPLPLLPPIETDPSKSSPGRRYGDDELIATSPNLAKFTITSAEGNPDSTLAAMQISPPRSSSVHSPESHPTLPSLQTALSMNSATSSEAFSLQGHSPTMTRPSPGQLGQFGPSPSSYSQPSPGMSPPGLPSHQSGLPNHSSYWRSTPREGSMSTPSDYHSTPSSMTTPASSAASYATPTATVTEQSRRESIDEPTSATQALASTNLLNGEPTANGPFTSSNFKCSYTGCTAPPFQTQYLLNSHANVHSSNRPHFCPVKECPRGPGGKGFKRKNEMIRHGLVHDSPGYVCPFCPDQQHKYPRPDNLQRHVRVHHVDRDRDDPALRGVLSQRPEGGSRGRRRRGGSG